MKTLNIPEETKREIIRFFLKTSVPRIIEREKESEGVKRVS